jgi:hypothetical protein
MRLLAARSAPAARLPARQRLELDLLPELSAAPAPEPPTDAAQASGWLVSSWELREGLAVTEHDSIDRVVNELPLCWWLAWQEQSALRSAAPAGVRPGG